MLKGTDSAASRYSGAINSGLTGFVTLSRRMSSMTSETDLLGGIIADANGADLALLIELAKRRGCLLDGDERVGPMHLVYIDVVRLETTERALKFPENPPARGVAFDLACCPVEAYFCGEDGAISEAVLAQSFSHNLLGASLSVDRCGIEQIDAVVESGMDSANRFLLVRAAPHPAANGPGAERDPRRDEISALDIDVFQHGVLPFLEILVFLAKPLRVGVGAIEMLARFIKFKLTGFRGFRRFRQKG